MTELKACPFCGGTDLMHVDCGVYCKNTECEGNVDFGHFIGGNEEESKVCKEAVAKAWNTRTGLSREKMLEFAKSQMADIRSECNDEFSNGALTQMRIIIEAIESGDLND